MATKSTKVAKTGDKRKAPTGDDKPSKKFIAKKESSEPKKKVQAKGTSTKKAPAKSAGPDSARKLWKNNDGTGDSSDDDDDNDGAFSDEEDGAEAPPAKKARKPLEHVEPSKQFEKEKSTLCTVASQTCPLSLSWRSTDSKQAKAPKRPT